MVNNDMSQMIHCAPDSGETEYARPVLAGIIQNYLGAALLSKALVLVFAYATVATSCSRMAPAVQEIGDIFRLKKNPSNYPALENTATPRRQA